MNNLIVKEYLGNGIEFKMVDGCVYANANKMADGFGGSQKLKDWKDSPNTKKYLEALESKIGKISLIKSERGKTGGTWIHEKLILIFARYLSVEFELWCDEQISTLLREGKVETKPSITKDKRLEIMERNSKVKESKIYLKIAEMAKTENFKNIMLAYGANTVAGKEILPLPEIGEKTLTADQVARKLNISSNRVGRLANKFGLKNDKNGIWVQDKKKHCDGEITAFRYYESAVDEFRKIL